MEKLTDVPKVSQLGWGALSDSPQHLQICMCFIYHSAVLPLKYTDSSLKGKAHIESFPPHLGAQALRGGEWDRQMMEAEHLGPLTPSTSMLSSLPGHKPPGTMPPCFQTGSRGRQRLPGSSPGGSMGKEGFLACCGSGP